MQVWEKYKIFKWYRILNWFWNWIFIWSIVVWNRALWLTPHWLRKYQFMSHVILAHLLTLACSDHVSHHRNDFPRYKWFSLEMIYPMIAPFHTTYPYNTVWKVSTFGVFLVRIFPYLGWIQRDTFPHLNWIRRDI